MNDQSQQDEEEKKFEEEFHYPIGSDKLEEFILRAAEIGKKLELSKIQNSLIDQNLMIKINFSDPKNMINILSLLPEFIFYCSCRDSKTGATESPKTIPISNFKCLLLKIIDNRETDSIDDILKEIISLIFVLDEQNEGASATVNAMKFACELVKDHSDSQYEVALGIRLMAVLINSQYVPEETILDALSPAKFKEPYIRKNQYIAIKEILSRAGPISSEQSNYRQIPFDHQIFTKILDSLGKVELRNSYQKFQIFKEYQNKGLNPKKWDNIIVIGSKKNYKTVFEFDQWVQCQFISLIPYIYQIEKYKDEKNKDEKNKDEKNKDEKNKDEKNKDEKNKDEKNNDEANNDETNNDEANNDETNNDETNNDETNNDETNNDETNNDETNNDETNNDEANNDEANNDEANNDETNNDETNNDEANNDEANNDETNNDETNNDETNNDESNNDEKNKDETKFYFCKIFNNYKCLSIADFSKLKELSWNVQFNYLIMLKSSKEILAQSGGILADFYFNAEMYSDFQTACISTIIEFLKIEQSENEFRNTDELLKKEISKCIQIKKNDDNEEKETKTVSLFFFEYLNEQAKGELKEIADIIKTSKTYSKINLKLNFLYKIIPILTSLMIYFFKNFLNHEIEINEIFNRMNQIPINIQTNCCRVFLDPFFINVPPFKSEFGQEINKKISESSKTAHKALHLLMISNDDFDDRLFFINIVDTLFESGHPFKEKNISLILSLIDIISNDPVYIVRDSAVQTVLKLLGETTFSDVLGYIQQIFPGSSFNGKKSLLSLIASIISSIDPYEEEEKKELLFRKYIDQIFLIIKDTQNKDLKKFFKDMLMSIWTLLPYQTKKHFTGLFA